MNGLANPYEVGYASIIMHIAPLPNLPPQLTIHGHTYRAVPDFHCTLVSLSKLASQLAEHDGVTPEVAEQQVLDVATEAINRIKPTFAGYLNEIRLADKLSVDKRTIIVMAQVAGLREVFDELNSKLGLNQPVQPAHVTMYHDGKDFPFGISLNSSADLDEYTRPLDRETSSELGNQLDSYKIFTWSGFMSPAPIRNNFILELHIPNFGPPRDFYRQFGFIEIDYDPLSGGGESDLGYFELKREDSLGRTQLNFYGDKDSVAKHARFKEFPADTPRGYAVEITFPVDDVENLWERVGRHLPKKQISQPLEIKRWGKRDFRVIDPFGFYVRFTEPVDWNQDL
jgi:uncharacterized glyoxalase superfamily protein PhnB